MAVRLRLTRVGNRKNPIWRVVVADGRSKRDGRVIETVGRYNPQRQPSEIVLDRERIDAWRARGAQPSEAVLSLLRASERSAPPQQAVLSEPTPEPVVPEPDDEAPPPTAPPGETEVPDVSDAQSAGDGEPVAEEPAAPSGDAG
ncbi:MAG: 30S ribosomal protein S16 [Actinomycetota bacterium]|nr:30S ribosomal protein S16 [Actinomycetota bacterium]